MARAWADVDLSAVRANVRALAERSAPAAVCAVVKADGYGHGAEPVGRAALDGGASWLAVAQVPEAVELRDAGIDAPIFLLAEPRPGELDQALGLDLDIAVYRPEVVEALGDAALRDRRPPVRAHLKVDTGMRRVGAEPDDALALAKAVERHPGLTLEALWTHCAVADEPGNDVTADQLRRFDAVVTELDAAGIRPRLRHAANSAAAIAHPASRYDLVRCGIAIYGIPPAPALAGAIDLVPALRLATEVSFVKRVPASEGVSYGHRQRTTRATVMATLPVGYADGLARRLPLLGQEVLVGGSRAPMIGVVTMDQVMVDCGPDAVVGVGDEVVLLGAQGGERIAPDEWAERLDTVSYEVVCAIGPRVERRYVG